MKSLFVGYFKPTDDEFQEMWKCNTIVFDTNVLLNLYRYSEDTRAQLLSLFEALGERIWIPRKVADEFFDNRLEVLGKQIQEYENLIKDLGKIRDNLKNTRQHPFVSDITLQNICDLFEKLNTELRQSKDNLLARLSNDEILQKVGDLFNGKVGNGVSESRLEEIYKEGGNRVEKKIPPGFKDAKNKASSGDNYKIYGDLILWNEIMENATSIGCGAIFVSDDKKEDWWLESHGRTIGPSPSLIQEFREKTKHSFFMYTVDRFIELASEFLQKQVSTEVIEEARDIRQSVKPEISLAEDDSYSRYLFAVITEQELLEKLSDYEKLINGDPFAYIGLRHFVTSVLGEQGYEINHSYAILNNLIQKDIVKLYEKQIGTGSAKAITLKHE